MAALFLLWVLQPPTPYVHPVGYQQTEPVSHQQYLPYGAAIPVPPPVSALRTPCATHDIVQQGPPSVPENLVEDARGLIAIAEAGSLRASQWNIPDLRQTFERLKESIEYLVGEKRFVSLAWLHFLTTPHALADCDRLEGRQDPLV
jgi:hypothetical protein